MKAVWRERTGDPSGGSATPTSAGVAAAWEHERAWEMVQDWIDGAGPLPASLDKALAVLP